MSWTDRFLVRSDVPLSLDSIDPADTTPMTNLAGKVEAQELTAANTEMIRGLHQLLWAANSRSLLIVLQGMDTCGKDGTIRQVMSGINPQGCTVTSFKVPSEEERDHDFLWRIHRAAPRKGDIGVFNRSHYEDVVTVRIHSLVPETTWRPRFEHINNFERQLTDAGVCILKFFLHISKAEQKERLQARLDDPTKNWKFSEGDLAARALWDQYMVAYAEALTRCSTPWAPWRIVPADKKWFRNLVVSQVIADALRDMNLKWPRPATDLSKVRL